MSRPLRIGIAFFLALVPALALAGPAWAGGEASVMRFGFPAGNGYSIGVFRDDATIGLVVKRSKRSRHADALTIYYARAELSANRIEASYGDLGDVSMRFKPSGRIVQGRPQRDCRGPDHTTTRFGVFVGSLRFRGEGGYVSTQIHRVKGKLISPPSLDCAGSAIRARQGGQAPKRAKRTFLKAGFRSGLGYVSFEARTNRAHKVHYVATAEQGGRQLATFRYAFADAPPSTFVTDNALSFASLTPPPPFSGSGSIQRNADGSRSWTGSLAVSFLGDPDVPLTGPQFKTRLTRGW